MKYFLHTCLLFSLLFLLSIPVYAQQLALKTYTVEDGLIQSSVYSIIQDKNGYMWFGTEGGVSKFNGSKFINYTPEKGLAQNHVRVILEDRSGAIWFGTEDGGISRLTKTGFKNYSKKDGVCDNKILSAYEDENGDIWFGTDNGLSIYHKGKFSTLAIKDGLHSNTIRTIYRDRKGSIWFSSGIAGGGISNKTKDRFRYFTEDHGLLSNVVVCIAEDRDGNIWFGTDSGVSVFDGKSFSNYTSANGLTNEAVISLFYDKSGTMWIGTYDGLYKYEDGKFEKYSTNNGLSSKIILSIAQDNRGDIWIGTSNGGVSRLPAERFISYTIKDGLPAEAVYAINEDKYGSIWIGTDGGGITKLTDKKLNTTSLKNISDLHVSSILFQNNGVGWIGTQNGLNKITQNKNIKVLSKEEGLSDIWINSVSDDRTGNIWIGTDNGLSRYSSERIISYTKKDGLADSVIYTVIEDKNGWIWIGTANGLSCIKANKIINYTTEDGLVDNRVYSIYEDSKGYLWFGTEKGASRFDGTAFRSFLPNNITNYIIDDGIYLYIGTNNGLNVIELNKVSNDSILEFKVFTAKEGLASSESTQRGVFKDSKGNIWFGSVKGITKYNPKYRASLVASPTILTDLIVNDKQISMDSKIELSYSENYLKFEFNAISFAFAEKLLYRYSLDGIDNHWNESREPVASYPYLPPGKYTFRVKAKNGDGVWSETPATISFIITPPFWATWWFRTILTFVVISSIYMIYVIKTQQVKKRNIELAKMVRERTHELELEKNKSDELLHNILPASLVDELKLNGVVQPREFKNVSIMFTDFKGFTYIASVLPADKLVSELNDMFKEFDRIIVKYGLEKLKTIGDSYMVGAGLPKESNDHAVRIIMAGLEMQRVIKVRNETSAIKWEMRTGVHSGYVIAGVVGTKKFSYDIWGDTVNIASRMESAGTPGEINISAYTYMLVRDHFDCEYRGKVTAKGKGDLDMYFVKAPKVTEKQKTILPSDTAINN